MKLPHLSYFYEQDWLVERCVGKRVLHLGCAGDSSLYEGRRASLHYRVHEVAASICGVEIDASAAAVMKKVLPESRTNRYVVGSVERLEHLDLDEEYDVILAGSIIEHLSEPGRMIAGGAAKMATGGRFLVATPNCWGLIQFIRVAARRNEAIDPQHVAWYSPATLASIFERAGLAPDEWGTGYGWRTRHRMSAVKRLIGTGFFRLFPHLGGSLLASFQRPVA